MSFTSVAFSSLRVLYIKCTTCFSWYATRFRVIYITLARALTANHEPAPRVRGMWMLRPRYTDGAIPMYRGKT